MKTEPPILLAAVLALAALPLAAALQKPVKTAAGLLSGVPGSDPSITVFKGVPFAAPPVGELRWRAPRPTPAWQGVRAADRFGANCMQQIVERKDPWTYEFMAHGPVSEDCLYLNVWTAAKGANEKRPVFVYIHGGAFTEGSGSVPAYDGEGLAKKGLVVVTINYRLGVLGFLAHPELTKESDRNASGNYGLLDMVAALQWIHDNIAGFGGDPACVTIAGQSAGAMAVHALVESPLAKGLFHRAVAESGALNDVRKLADAEQDGVRFAESKGAHSMAELRAMTWEQLTARPASGAPIRFGPVADGRFAVSEQPPTDVPFLTGSNGDENGAVPHPTVQADAWRQQVARRYADRADAFLKLYPVASDAEAQAAQNASARDQARTSLYLWAVNREKTGKAKVYTYFYTHPLPGPDVEKYGAFHTSEVPYVFNSLARCERPFGDADRKLAETVSSYWANFARTGDPNGKGLPAWPAVAPGAALTMELGDSVRPIPVAPENKLEFFREVPPARR
jgi:para-nitrobenzyl esterase